MFGDGDTFKLICKASSAKERWMKSTKAMEIAGVGVVVQVTTQQGDNVAEALQFVRAVIIPIEGNKENGRKIVAQGSVEHNEHLARVRSEQLLVSMVACLWFVALLRSTPSNMTALRNRLVQSLLGHKRCWVTVTLQSPTPQKVLIVSTSNGDVPANVGDYVMHNGFDFYPAPGRVVAASYYL